MFYSSIAIFFKFLALSILLALFLFADGTCLSSTDSLGAVLREVAAVCRDPNTQWTMFLYLGICYLIFSIARWRIHSKEVEARCFICSPLAWNTPNLWLFGALLIGATLYVFYHLSSTYALTLLGGALIGQGVALLIIYENELRNKEHGSEFHNLITFRVWIVTVLVVFLSLASVWEPEFVRNYKYHGNVRWSGPWTNPNTFGLLMGTGIALVLRAGEAIICRISDKKPKATARWILTYVIGILCIVALFLMGRGLLHSFSRGAWLAAFCGVTYLFWQWINREPRQIRERQSSCSSRGLPRSSETKAGNKAPSLESEVRNRKSETRSDKAEGGSPHLTPALSPRPPGGEGEYRSRVSRVSRSVGWLRSNWLPFSIILFSVTVLALWHFRQTEWHPARRALSVGNVNDFSWRNRVAAWEGALQMLAERPWFGMGWNQPEPMYEHYYRPARLEESAAIQMNDYLMLGATLGVPALFCFGAYLWLSLRRSPQSIVHSPQSGFKNAMEQTEDSGLRTLDLLQTACRAGAIVLLVGFWFDGGLFKLATASVFWILIELGNAKNRMI